MIQDTARPLVRALHHHALECVAIWTQAVRSQRASRATAVAWRLLRVSECLKDIVWPAVSAAGGDLDTQSLPKAALDLPTREQWWSFVTRYFAQSDHDEMSRAMADLVEVLQVVYGILLPRWIALDLTNSTDEQPLVSELAGELDHLCYHLETDFTGRCLAKQTWDESDEEAT